MKLLTSITIIMTIPTMVSSFMGMNVTFPFNVNVPGFYGVTAFTILVTAIGAFWLKKKDML
jgi:magnesium transporter